MKNLIIGGLLTVIMKPYIVSVDSVGELIFCLLIMWFSFWVIIEELEGLLKEYRKKWKGGNREKKGSCKNQVRR
jgi:uncharacterized membrane protein